MDGFKHQTAPFNALRCCVSPGETQAAVLVFKHEELNSNIRSFYSLRTEMKLKS